MKRLKRSVSNRHPLLLPAFLVTALVALWGVISVAYAIEVPTAPYTLDTGYLGHHYGPQPPAPLPDPIPPDLDVQDDHTATRTQSKLWWHDGRWWAALWNADVHEYHIYRLDWGTQVWRDTGVAVDGRFDTQNDVLMDSASNKLYIVSHVEQDNPSRVNGIANWARLYRYTYDDALNTYVPDPGLPFLGINEDKTNSVVIDKDTDGNLWATYVSREQGGGDNYQVYVNVSEDDGQTWGPRFTLNPDHSEALVARLDVSTIVPLGNTVALLWTNQVDGNLYFAEYNTALDYDDPAAWAVEALPGPGGIPGGIDDHLSVKVNSAGQLFAAVKTSGDNGGPLIGLVARDTDGTAYFHDYSDAADNDTRPILALNEDENVVHIFATGKPGGSKICYKSAEITADLAGMSFPPGNCGTSFIDDDVLGGLYDRFDSSTTSKHDWDATTGLVVLASDDHNGRVYGHNVMGDPPPVVTGQTPARGATGLPRNTVVTAQFSKNMNVATVVTPGNFTLESSGGPVAGSVSYDGASRTATFTPSALLAPNTEYTALVTTGMQDDGGQALYEAEQWSFTTGTADQLPAVQFDSTTYSVAENGGTATITVALSDLSGVDVQVIYATGTGTATANVDYTPTGGQLTIPAGEMTATFTVTINDDALNEPDETVALMLSNPVNATLGAPSEAVLTIVDDDDPPTVQFDAADYTVDEAAGTATITVTLSAPSGLAVSVDYATSDGTATAGSDYVAASGLLEFAAGETSKTFTVTINDDTVDEPDETINLTLSNPNDVTLGDPSTATLTIVDDDTGGPGPGDDEFVVYLPAFRAP